MRFTAEVINLEFTQKDSSCIVKRHSEFVTEDICKDGSTAVSGEVTPCLGGGGSLTVSGGSLTISGRGSLTVLGGSLPVLGGVTPCLRGHSLSRGVTPVMGQVGITTERLTNSNDFYLHI